MEKTKFSRLWAWTTIAFFSVLAVWKQADGQPVDTAKLDTLFDYLEQQDETMASVAISRAGTTIYKRAIGYRLLSGDRKIAADIDTKYRIWSITKMFTATMILQLTDEGKIGLDTTIAKFFPTIANAGSITIRQMLLHRSGIHDFTKAGDQNISVPSSQERNDMVKTIARFKPDFQPGEKFEYSNSNYLLLGYIIEKLEGLPFEIALYKRITSKIGLSDTYYGKAALDTIGNKSLSYRRENGKWVEVAEGDFSGLVPGAAGSIVSTPTDLVRFMEALFSGKLLSMRRLAEMTDINEFYGLGIHLMFNGRSTGFGHGGGYIASFAKVMYYPADSLVVAYCTNGQAYSMDNILGQVLSICHDKSYRLPFTRPSIDVPEAILQRYAGVYETTKFLLTVSLEDGHLVIAPAGQPKSTFYAATERRFFSKDHNIEIAFMSNDAGEISGLQIFHGDRKMVAKKIE